MPIVTWTAIPSQRVQPGSVIVPWVQVVDGIGNATHLQIIARGQWTALPGLLAPCGPDGLAGLILPADRVVLADAPPGALIGRLGGSSASLKADGAFVIGSSCVVKVPDAGIGPLFISFNITARPVLVSVAIELQVSGATPNL
jgi:hypothetical protein